MSPETILNLINISIIVLVTTILYCVCLIIVRAYSLVKRWNKAEQKFYEETMTKFRMKEWKSLGGKGNS
jgi:hypothetical protein